MFHEWNPRFGKCNIEIGQDDGFSKAMEPAFSEFQRSNVMNDACST